ncbi:hypothetical protein QJS10_CPB15g00836 [Acorus calamus]|uniref:Reverse transcriptase domain-containing protein n=1 Tax=Acorus calamus TaxID=4465 RepID=A0AAV9D6V5_ACOCL|nr:hypothetical protein QJS10_CPB15g00836 [Acorus calamus]
MEILSQSLDRAFSTKQIDSFTKKSHSIGHLLFADNFIIFSATSVKAGRGLRELLNTFAQQSGLELNKGKSQVFCGGRPEHQPQFVADIGISLGQLLVTYLGLPLFTGALTPRLCLPLIDKLRKRYLSKFNIWEVAPSSSGLWIWPKLLASRRWIQPEVHFLIFSGNTMQAWSDPWIKGQSLKARLHPYVHTDLSELVSSLIKDGAWVKPTWWSTNWEDIWADIVEHEREEIGEETLERYNRLFKRIYLHKAMLYKQICSSVHNIFLGKSLKGELTDLVKRLATQWDIAILPLEPFFTEVSWQPPLEGWYKSNSNGSLAVQDKLLSSINVLEYKAILEGLRICKEHGIHSIHLESDSSTAVAWVQGKPCLPWHILRARNELGTILSSLTQWRVSHVFREGNQAADYLASLRMMLGNTYLLPDQFDGTLQHILAKDASGENYIRSNKR